MSDNTLLFPLIYIAAFMEGQNNQKSMLVSTYWPYYSEIECKDNYRRVMATCVRNVYDNDKIYYTPWLEAPWMFILI